MSLFFNLLVLAILHQWPTHAEGPPKVTGSYMAFGEVVNRIPDIGNTMLQMAFEENYDSKSQNAAFRTWIVGKNVTFLENFDTKQSFQYTAYPESGVVACDLLTQKEWSRDNAPPSLLAYEDTNGTVRFSLKQLFALDDSYLIEENQEATYRGMAARMWMHEIKPMPVKSISKTISVYSYWSDGTWTLTSSEKQVPLGFVVSILNRNLEDENTKDIKEVDLFINVFGFVHNTYDKKIFEPVEGVVCSDRKKTLEFPDMSDYKSLFFRSEYILLDSQEIRHVETWYDSSKRLLRTDLDRMEDEPPIFEGKSRKYTMEIVSGYMNMVFRVNYFKGTAKCVITSLDDYTVDEQSLVNPTLKEHKVADIFGNRDNYIYLGKTSKRNIPCHMYQGTRTDWPGPGMNITSLWEWCFAMPITGETEESVAMRENELPLVMAQATVIDSQNPADYPNGMKLRHNFYDVLMEDPGMLNPDAFDISRCFDSDSKRSFQFLVDVEISRLNREDIEAATWDVTILQKWKAIIILDSQLPAYTLRVTNVKSTVFDDKLYVRFVLLGPHKDLPKEVMEKQLSILQAEINLRKSIDDGKLFITFKNNANEEVKLAAVKASLENPQKEINPIWTTPGPSDISTQSTLPDFTLLTEPDDDTSPKDKTSGTGSTTSGTGGTTSGTGGTPSSDQTPSPTLDVTEIIEKTFYKGHGRGTVAAVSIAMLLIGVSIGSAGTFVKFFGLPDVLKRVTGST